MCECPERQPLRWELAQGVWKTFGSQESISHHCRGLLICKWISKILFLHTLFYHPSTSSLNQAVVSRVFSFLLLRDIHREFATAAFPLCMYVAASSVIDSFGELSGLLVQEL